LDYGDISGWRSWHHLPILQIAQGICIDLNQSDAAILFGVAVIVAVLIFLKRRERLFVEVSPTLAKRQDKPMFERALRWAFVFIAVLGLAAGGIAFARHRGDLADLSFTLATVPVVVALAISILRDFLAGRLGVDAIALVSMSALPP
jgi:hypothetical protein